MSTCLYVSIAFTSSTCNFSAILKCTDSNVDDAAPVLAVLESDGEGDELIDVELGL